MTTTYKALAVVLVILAGAFTLGYTMGRTSAAADNYGEIYAQAMDDAYEEISRGMK